jgi:hypothetical protein
MEIRDSDRAKLKKVKKAHCARIPLQSKLALIKSEPLHVRRLQCRQLLEKRPQNESKTRQKEKKKNSPLETFVNIVKPQSRKGKH